MPAEAGARWPVRDDVRAVAATGYEAAMEGFLAAFRGRPGVVALYQLGSVKFPGISDLDVIVVVEDGVEPGTDFQRLVRAAAGPDGGYVFSHAPYVMDAASFPHLPSLFFADNLRLRWGRELAFAARPADEAACHATQVAVEAAVGQSFAFLRALANRSAPNLRSLLCHLNAVRHNFRTMERLGAGEPPPHWAAYAARVDALRGAWFGLPADARVAEAWALMAEARDILLDILDRLGRLVVARGYVKGEGSGMLSLLDVNLLLRFAPGARAGSLALANPLGFLREAPGIGGWLGVRPRWRDLVGDVAVLELPGSLHAFLDGWQDAEGAPGRVLAARRLAADAPGATRLAPDARAWLGARERALDAHLGFLAQRRLTGYLPLTPASWLTVPTSLANRLRTRWNRGWAGRRLAGG